MSENQTSEENNNTNPLQTNNKARNKKIALIIGVLFVLGLIIIPRVWAKFNKKRSCLP